GGVEIAAAEMPDRGSIGNFASDTGVFVGRTAARIEMDFEAAGWRFLYRRGGCVVSRCESFVAGFEDVAKFWVVGLEEDGNAADFNGDRGKLRGLAALAPVLARMFARFGFGEGGAGHQANP